MKTMKTQTAESPGRCWKDASFRQDKRPACNHFQSWRFRLLCFFSYTEMIKRYFMSWFSFTAHVQFWNLEHREKKIVSEGSNRRKLKSKAWESSFNNFFSLASWLIPSKGHSAPVRWRSLGLWASFAVSTLLFWWSIWSMIIIFVEKKEKNIIISIILW